MSNLEVRTEAIKGNLIGRRVKVMVPYDGGEYAEVGTVTGLAYPLVEVSTGGGNTRYRHTDQLQICDQ